MRRKKKSNPEQEYQKKFGDRPRKIKKNHKTTASALSILTRLAIADLEEEAEKSIRCIVELRDNTLDDRLRRDCAKDIIEIRFGKPHQQTVVGGMPGRPIEVRSKSQIDFSGIKPELLKAIALGGDKPSE